MDQLDGCRTKEEWQITHMLDPKDLNRALQRENYPMPTIEEVASRLHGARVFPLLDISNGFWHIVLDEESSFCITVWEIPLEKDAVRDQICT